MNIPLGDRLHMARRKRRMSQTKLAELTGISNANISHIETGQRTNITIETLLKLANALSVSVDYLLGLKEDMERELSAAEAA
jgi:transcriptional regulator with XRE-family HTH domain